MIVPDYIKELLKKREKTAVKLRDLDSQLSDWLIENNIFNQVCCSENHSLFNLGSREFKKGSAKETIQYLESL